MLPMRKRSASRTADVPGVSCGGRACAAGEAKEGARVAARAGARAGVVQEAAGTDGTDMTEDRNIKPMRLARAIGIALKVREQLEPLCRRVEIAGSIRSIGRTTKISHD